MVFLLFQGLETVKFYDDHEDELNEIQYQACKEKERWLHELTLDTALVRPQEDKQDIDEYGAQHAKVSRRLEDRCQDPNPQRVREDSFKVPYFDYEQCRHYRGGVDDITFTQENKRWGFRHVYRYYNEKGKSQIVGGGKTFFFRTPKYRKCEVSITQLA